VEQEIAMFKKILVPADLTDRHERAVELAAELAAQGGADIVLLHVVEMIQGLPMEEEGTFYKRLERIARGHLERWSKHLAERQRSCQVEVLFGNRAGEIARYASENGIDLIVLTARPFDPAAPAASLGSMSYRIGLLARSPVLLVK
jgi:nucleotide-binding universal stress UspA family protein